MKLSHLYKQYEPCVQHPLMLAARGLSYGFTMTMTVPADMAGYGQVSQTRHREILELCDMIQGELGAHAVSSVMYNGSAGVAGLEATWTTWNARQRAMTYLYLSEPDCQIKTFRNGG